MEGGDLIVDQYLLCPLIPAMESNKTAERTSKVNIVLGVLVVVAAICLTMIILDSNAVILLIALFL
jgi:hypothetical protein